mmetsp:Transcript_9800/g.19253  ORF Transcript_9800/g.19253 Transcript_9800/m.19253 type:complete len:211 (+) Transcript_9800:174-806(+)|eukprot:CAMPEP_0171509980 /NCGR_PEP_ID=MMETSP0959-20130129/102_1 /TAXON_ID=87120 /ORGANISM="Aurantiochytrium limacinum, Strain ATCCMYA-1381" /LENGTH=210 /DNA_ID=CAMNT_0012047279 /DNA_START=107 /DNA_END=739 /DNA_ORIENTATION=+
MNYLRKSAQIAPAQVKELAPDDNLSVDRKGSKRMSALGFDDLMKNIKRTGWRSSDAGSKSRFFRSSDALEDVAALNSADELRSRLSSTGFDRPVREPQVLFKKTVYKVDVSLAYGLILLFLAVYDLCGIYYEWSSEALPESWHSALIYTHVIAFYLLTTGFVVCNETHQHEYFRIAFASLVINIVGFALRLHYEIYFADLIPAQYYPAAP